MQDSVELPSGRILKGEELKEYEAWRNNNPYRDKFFSILGDSISTFERTIPDGYCAFYQSEVLEEEWCSGSGRHLVEPCSQIIRRTGACG